MPLRLHQYLTRLFAEEDTCLPVATILYSKHDILHDRPCGKMESATCVLYQQPACKAVLHRVVFVHKIIGKRQLSKACAANDFFCLQHIAAAANTYMRIDEV